MSPKIPQNRYYHHFQKYVQVVCGTDTNPEFDRQNQNQNEIKTKNGINGNYDTHNSNSNPSFSGKKDDRFYQKHLSNLQKLIFKIESRNQIALTPLGEKRVFR